MSKEERLRQLSEIGFVFCAGKGGGKRTSKSVFQRLNPNHDDNAPKAKHKPSEEESESSDDNEETFKTQEALRKLTTTNAEQSILNNKWRMIFLSGNVRFHLGIDAILEGTTEHALGLRHCCALPHQRTLAGTHHIDGDQATIH